MIAKVSRPATIKKTPAQIAKTRIETRYIISAGAESGSKIFWTARMVESWADAAARVRSVNAPTPRAIRFHGVRENLRKRPGGCLSCPWRDPQFQFISML